MVAQRLSTIKSVDVIVALNDGMVAEQGTHHGLMQQQGIYYQLATSQVGLEDTTK